MKIPVFKIGKEEVVRLFVPLPDITTFELAVICAKVYVPFGLAKRGVIFTKEQWDGLHEGFKRHFKDVSEVDELEKLEHLTDFAGVQ